MSDWKNVFLVAYNPEKYKHCFEHSILLTLKTHIFTIVGIRKIQ